MNNLTELEYNDLSCPEEFIKDVLHTISYNKFSKIKAGKFTFDFKDGFLRLWFGTEILAQWKLYFFEADDMQEKLVLSILEVFHQ